MNILYRIIGVVVVIVLLPLILLCFVTLFLAWCVSRLWAEDAHMCNGTIGSTTVNIKDQPFGEHTYTIPAETLKVGELYEFVCMENDPPLHVRQHLQDMIAEYCKNHGYENYRVIFKTY